MIPINDPRIEKYMMELAGGGEDPLLGEMEQEARRREFPIVDRLVGRLLFVLARLKSPSLVVELGSGFGYSAYWFARAMDRGKVVLTDRSGENLAMARGTFERAGLLQRAEFREGDAVEAARGYKDIDILFMDLDKRSYAPAFLELLPNLAPGALVVADNTLWYGRVADADMDPDTEGIREFNRTVFGRSDFMSVILPLRDGVLVASRLP